jgi:serine/threonine protein kinase
MPTLLPGSRVGAFPYQIVKALDDNPGAMSEVYLASVRSANTGDESYVVLKLALGQQSEHQNFYQQTLDNEVQRLRRLKHPGIVRVFPIEREGLPNLPYVAEATALSGKPLFSIMEYLSGGSLSELIAEKSLDIGDSLEIVRSIAGALDYLHSRGQVHLDIKPDNVLFRVPPVPGEPPEPVLIDFGIARNIGQPGLQARTLHYASPERIMHERQPEKSPESAAVPHPAMDVYALGVVLYEMLTGQLPFRGRSNKSLTSAILNDTPKPPSAHNRKVNAELDALVLSMLNKDPRKRPTAEEVAFLLDQIAIKGHYRPRYPNRANPAPARPRRMHGIMAGQPQWFWVLLAIVFLQFLVLLGTYPDWRGDVTMSAEGIRRFLENIRTTLLPFLVLSPEHILFFAFF